MQRIPVNCRRRHHAIPLIAVPQPIQASTLSGSASLLAFLGPVAQACADTAGQGNHPHVGCPGNGHDDRPHHDASHRPNP